MDDVSACAWAARTKQEEFVVSVFGTAYEVAAMETAFNKNSLTSEYFPNG